MPRGPRLDCPGAVHHVIVRGIERCDIFRSEKDRDDLLTRIDRVLPGSQMAVYAWALMSNHVHMLVRTGTVPLSTVVGRLFSAYALAFNRRHGRCGHLFQNRFKSILVDEDAYLLQLVRYIHLDPMRARLLPRVEALDAYPWTGHATLLGQIDRPWQHVEPVLQRFGSSLDDSRRAYRRFVLDGLEDDQAADLGGGGVRRSGAGRDWDALPVLPRGREQWAFGERVLGSSDFVQRALADTAPRSETRASDRAESGIEKILAHLDLPSELPSPAPVRSPAWLPAWSD